jgi:Flp pilus assembly protein TadB
MSNNIYLIAAGRTVEWLGIFAVGFGIFLGLIYAISHLFNINVAISYAIVFFVFAIVSVFQMHIDNIRLENRFND